MPLRNPSATVRSKSPEDKFDRKDRDYIDEMSRSRSRGRGNNQLRGSS